MIHVVKNELLKDFLPWNIESGSISWKKGSRVNKETFVVVVVITIINIKEIKCNESNKKQATRKRKFQEIVLCIYIYSS
jgi:hypothetical protein